MKLATRSPRSGQCVQTWRVLIDPAQSAAVNMARDHALAACSPPDQGTVRFYRWQPAALSFGRNEPVTVGYREVLRQRPELDVVRRPTGGRAVIHDKELTYAAVFPAKAMGGLRKAYRMITEGLLAGLRRLGVDAHSAQGTTLVPDAGPCFLEPGEGEIVVGGRKLVGSAQVRIGGAILQHGSLLLAGDQTSLVMARAGAVAGVVPKGRPRPAGQQSLGENWTVQEGRSLAQPATLAELLGEAPPWGELVDALRSGLATRLGGRWIDGSFTPTETALAEELESRYSSPVWTWRR